MRPPLSRRQVGVAALVVGVLLLWVCVALRYQSLSAAPLHPGRVLLNVGLLTLGHYLIGRALAWLLARREPVPGDGWAWCILLGYGAAPTVLWVADRLGVREVGWGLLAALVLGGLALAWIERGARPGPRAGAVPVLVLLLCLAAATLIGLDHVVYLRPDPQGVLLAPPEDNLAHTAMALEWARQQPCQYVLSCFTPEPLGARYHFLTDVQIAAWWKLCGGDQLDFVHCERTLLAGFSLLIGLYLLAKALFDSTSWTLVAVGLFAAFPYWFLDLGVLPERESLQRLWISFTYGNGAALAAGFLASVWSWLHRGQPGFARIALALAAALLLAKVYFALLACSAACALVLYLRPRAWALWLGILVLIGLGMIALQPHGPGILAFQPEWAPGRFWSDLCSYRGPFVRDGRWLANFVDWIEVGLAVLFVGAIGAGMALRRWWPESLTGRSLVLVVACSWAVFLAYVSLLWFVNPHQSAFQFLPWLAVLSVLAGIVGVRAALERWLSDRRALRLGLACAGIVTWAAVLGRAYVETDGFAKRQWTAFPFATESWEVLTWLRTQSPPTARVLAPFESPLLDSIPSPYAISGVAGRRAVDEHFTFAIWFPGYAERMAERKQKLAQFYRDPRPELLATLVAEWSLDYVVLPTRAAAQMPAELGHTVCSNPKWSLLDVRKR